MSVSALAEREDTRSRTGEPVDEIVLNAVVEAAVSGDTAAIHWLLGHVRPLVLRYCQSRIGGHRTAIAVDDVAQEVLLALFRALPTYRNQGRPFLAFVYGIAGHKVADARRNAARIAATMPVPEIPDVASQDATPEQHALQFEMTSRIEQLLRRVLSPRQHEILVLRLVVGLSAEEVADVMGSTPGAIRVAQHRALSRLRKVVSQ
ncbi:RNA polymerase sigma factor ShbA [Actinocrispum wychmicini]|uniref:RNA polymerase sigma-70 factor (ECF subfamily) n=1 Tax=Actinocrispum wychmicini TaxID=1213861 RepID=A0A4R2K3Y5_9PSEU|nr:RNA polymerase sigma factor ShbA [Actinocrispum wychmicini]TCO64499.1 RNA polymerase sigma-70 factor (ECF subfamily) [Actinocrispum wychmicini]